MVLALNVRKTTTQAVVALIFLLGLFLMGQQSVSAAACYLTPANTGSQPTSYECPTNLSPLDGGCFFASLDAATGDVGTFRKGACPTGNGLPEPAYTPSDCEGPAIRAGAPEGDENHCGILDYVVIFINVLSALAAIAVVAAIIYGGIQYSSAGSDPQKVSAAKVRIRNAIIALIFFIFGYAILNWLVPGGVM